MSKDAKGHGSNGRGAQVQAMVNGIAANPNFDGAKMPYHMQSHENPGAHAPTNELAASQLASGAKSAPIPTHDSMGGGTMVIGGQTFKQGYDNLGAKALASRREASMKRLD